MQSILVVYAHPYPDRSRANRVLLEAVRAHEAVTVRSLYDLYPDFGIDVEAEQRALAAARVVVWQHPMYWYAVPALLKHWFEKVLTRGWAYGEGGDTLEGKSCLWVTTTGGTEEAFEPEGIHGHPFASFVPPVEQTARFCRMSWEAPLVVHGAHRVPDEQLQALAEQYRARLDALALEVSR